MQRRLAVLGSPIAHSRSPLLHMAAYRALGLDWVYERVESDGAGLGGLLEGLGPEWRGLSLTMPLKWDVLPLLDERHPLVEATGAANTVLLDGGRRIGFNTDVYGIVRSLLEHGVTDVREALVLGSGATAGTAIAAVTRLGARHVTVAARDRGRAAELAARFQVETTAVDFSTLDLGTPPDIVVNTLPNGVRVPVDFPRSVRATSVLFDVTYEPWPTPLAADWEATAVSGLDMLTLQALQQVRVFTSGDPERELPDEARVLAAMRAAVTL